MNINRIYSIAELANSHPHVRLMPYSHKILLENLLRNFDGKNVTQSQIDSLINFDGKKLSECEIQFTPSRVIMQDFTGVPCVVDLASMREAMKELGGNPNLINPQKKVQLVIDHSLQIDQNASKNAIEYNLTKEFERNGERYSFLKWGQSAFENFECVPPGVGIIHQINLEKLSEIVIKDDESVFFDTCIGTDSHTTMINGVGVLGWGVGGIEAEAAMLGQSISMLIPQVVGVKLTGTPSDNVFSTDIVLAITQKLRELNVIGKFVEFFGEAVEHLDIPVRATISNMCPEFGATCAIFAVDEKTIDYLKLTGRSNETICLVKEYHEKQGTFGSISQNTNYSHILEIDLSNISPSIAGPKRPQDRINLKDASEQFKIDINDFPRNTKFDLQESGAASGVSVNEQSSSSLKNGDIIIASITSCTNTSNPEVLIAAGLLAKRACELGIKPKSHVRTSFAPGSPAVVAYLQNSGLQKYLDELGFNIVGFGCATCIGNSGANDSDISQEIEQNNLAVAAVLSGNRNFEGRINPDVKMNYLASPPLVIAYAIAGNMSIDLLNEPISQSADGNSIFLRDIMPSKTEITQILNDFVTTETFVQSYENYQCGNDLWQEIANINSNTFSWEDSSTYIRKAPYFDNLAKNPTNVCNITNARVLLNLGDSVTTDHISPAGNIKQDSPAGKYLQENGISPIDFNSYGSRRGNHEVMVRGTFANIRLNNKLLPYFTGDEKFGGWTIFFDEINNVNGTSNAKNAKNDYQVMSVFDASEMYQKSSTDLVVFAGSEYGTGSSRDWAAKGTALLGVKSVIAKSFERIHRSNLIGMGVLPLEFINGESFEALGLNGNEYFDIIGIEQLNDVLNDNDKWYDLVGSTFDVLVKKSKNGEIFTKFCVKLRIDTLTECLYYLNGGILNFVLRNLLNESK